jgi:hypothetical protein
MVAETETETTKHVCVEANAKVFLKWIRERGGIAVWRSVDLSNPGASWSTPARTEAGEPTLKPTWRADNQPHKVFTSTDDVLVDTPREVKRFRVAVRHSGFAFNLTDASTKRVHREVDKAGKDAWYEFDYETQEAVIYVPHERITLSEWARLYGE